MKIADLIRKLRTKRGIKRSQLAELVGISESHLNKIEAGSRRPGIDRYEKIMDILNVDIVIKEESEFRAERLSL